MRMCVFIHIFHKSLSGAYRMPGPERPRRAPWACVLSGSPSRPGLCDLYWWECYPLLQVGKLRLSKLSLPKVMELVKRRVETQREEGGFESRFLNMPKLPGMGKERGGNLGVPSSCTVGGVIDHLCAI